LLSVVFVSSELEEVVAVSDRIIVLAAGRSAGHLGVEAFTRTMKGPAESGQICSVGRRKIAKKIAKNKRCYANPWGRAQGCC
jgi:ABC-type nitrate/sulfonate/bicarbonate transport system ATPase subunit